MSLKFFYSVFFLSFSLVSAGGEIEEIKNYPFDPGAGKLSCPVVFEPAVTSPFAGLRGTRLFREPDATEREPCFMNGLIRSNILLWNLKFRSFLPVRLMKQWYMSEEKRFRAMPGRN